MSFNDNLEGILFLEMSEESEDDIDDLDLDSYDVILDNDINDDDIEDELGYNFDNNETLNKSFNDEENIEDKEETDNLNLGI